MLDRSRSKPRRPEFSRASAAPAGRGRRPPNWCSSHCGRTVHLLRTSSLACSPLPRWGEGSQFQRLWRDEANQAEGHDSIRPEEAALRFTWRRLRAASPRTYFTPPPTAFDIAASCCRALSSASSMLKLAGFCLGGNSLKVLRNSPTVAWAGTSRNVRSAIHLP
jgi:hypothetical protein